MDRVEVYNTVCDRDGHNFGKVNEDFMVCTKCGKSVKIPKKKIEKCCPCNHGCKCYCSCCYHIHWTYTPQWTYTNGTTYTLPNTTIGTTAITY